MAATFQRLVPSNPSLSSLASCFLCQAQIPGPAPCCPHSPVPGSWVLGQSGFWGIAGLWDGHPQAMLLAHLLSPGRQRLLGNGQSNALYAAPWVRLGELQAFHCLMWSSYCSNRGSEIREGQLCWAPGAPGTSRALAALALLEWGWDSGGRFQVGRLNLIQTQICISSSHFPAVWPEAGCPVPLSLGFLVCRKTCQWSSGSRGCWGGQDQPSHSHLGSAAPPRAATRGLAPTPRRRGS